MKVKKIEWTRYGGDTRGFVEGREVCKISAIGYRDYILKAVNGYYCEKTIPCRTIIEGKRKAQLALSQFIHEMVWED